MNDKHTSIMRSSYKLNAHAGITNQDTNGVNTNAVNMVVTALDAAFNTAAGTLTKCLGFCMMAVLASPTFAALQEMEDTELSNVAGQAAFKIENRALGDTNFTKLNMGMEIKTQANIKELKLGEYVRNGKAGADIWAKNLSMGTVDDSTGQVNPFRIKDPFIEFATKNGKMVGIRFGFGEAQGFTSGDLINVNGNVAIGLSGPGYTMAERMKCVLSDPVCAPAKIALSTLYANATLTQEAVLMNDGTTGVANGERASYIGVVNGGATQAKDNPLLNFVLGLGLHPVKDCKDYGMQMCYPLSHYGTLNIGNMNEATGQPDGPAAKNMFLSMQTENMQWIDQTDAAKTVMALAGAFLNATRDANGNAAINATLAQAIDGIPMRDGCWGSAVKGC